MGTTMAFPVRSNGVNRKTRRSGFESLLPKEAKRPVLRNHQIQHFEATNMPIREATIQDIATLAMLISESNKDVALRFGLNAGNCAKHPSFCTADWIKTDLARGERYFILEEDSKPIACVAYENPRVGLAYLNRLSVLPAHRNRGIGARMVQHIVQLAKTESIQTISIGVIGEHTDLQRWYRKLGFISGETKRFPHLPFSVIYITHAVQSPDANPAHQ